MIELSVRQATIKRLTDINVFSVFVSIIYSDEKRAHALSLCLSHMWVFQTHGFDMRVWMSIRLISFEQNV